MQINNFGNVESFLNSKRPDISAVNWFFALEDMQKLMVELGNPQDEPSIIHVAGTSGKTSTCYYIARMLRLANKNTGLTVSPHVDSVSERVQVNDELLSQHEYLELFNEFTELKALQSIQITYFGLLVAFAYWVFAKKQMEYAVIEVGMGGRLDATNVVSNSNKVCVITDIGLDHTKFLGNDLQSIAREKAGIIQTGNMVFVANQSEDVLNVFREVAKEKQAILNILPEILIEHAPSFLPPFQKRNWSLANYVFDYLAIRDSLRSDKSIESANIQVPARMEEFSVSGKTLIVDGSHNSQKISALCEGIKQKYPNQKVAALISFVEGKDGSLKDSLGSLRSVCDELIVTAFNSSQDIYRQAIEPSIIGEAAKSLDFDQVKIIPDPKHAYEDLLTHQQDLLLVTGSFFLLSHVRPLIK